MAGVEYVSGRDAGCGYLLSDATGRPEEMSGLAETTLPTMNEHSEEQRIRETVSLTKFLPEAFGAKMVECRFCNFLGCH